MIVCVKPSKAISDILPNNKRIEGEMNLDLNKNEIIRCMNFGSVFDVDGVLIDEKYPLDEKIKYYSENVTVTVDDAKSIIPEIVPEFVKDYTFALASQVKDGNYQVLEFEFKTSVKEAIGGNMYGLFKSNSKAKAEYKVGDKWVAFNAKFTDLTTVSNGDKFTIRVNSKDLTEIEYTLTLKEGNNELAVLQDKVKVVE